MGVVSETLDDWRVYFRTSNSDIFDIIEHAIRVAASDCPQEFRIRRDRIAEILFSCKLAKCLRCDSLELAIPSDDDGDGGCCKGVKFERSEFEGGGGSSKGSKVNSCRDEHVEMNVNQVSNYSIGDAEALTDAIEEENQIVGEVLRIKEILDNCQDESVSVLFDSLRRLQLMILSVDSLKATEIGKSVNTLRKHSSVEIRHLARRLIEVWKDMVDEWVNATTAVGGTEGTPESANPSIVDDEEGLPSPPLDEGAAFFSANTTMELSQFFDGIDDDGNARNSGEFNKNRENGRKSPNENRNILKEKPPEAYVHVIDKKGEEMKKQGPVLKKQPAVVKPNKSSFNTEFCHGRSANVVNVEQNVSNGTTFQQKVGKATTVQKKPLAIQEEEQKRLYDTARLDAAKRKLHERYQQAETAKRQRTIQVMELHDIPKQGPVGRRNANTRPGNHNRHLANGRR